MCLLLLRLKWPVNLSDANSCLALTCTHACGCVSVSVKLHAFLGGGFGGAHVTTECAFKDTS